MRCRQTYGHGAGVSIQTGFMLAQETSGAEDVPLALRRWDDMQRSVVDATQKFSRLYGRVGTRWPSALLDVRLAFVWGRGKSVSPQWRINVAAHIDVTNTSGKRS